MICGQNSENRETMPRSVWNEPVWILAAFVMLSLSACTSLQGPLRSAEPPHQVLPSTDAAHLINISTQPSKNATQTVDSGQSQTENKLVTIQAPVEKIGSGVFVNSIDSVSSTRFLANAGQSFELAFDRAPISEVVNIVIGEMLGADFTISPEVKGEITLRSVRPVALADLPAMLNRTLLLAGVSLVETDMNSYAVVPSNKAGALARTPRLAGMGLPPGYGLVIVPLEFVSAPEMARVLQPFVPDGSRVNVDDVRQMLILSGDETGLQTLLQTIEMFDVDWLQAMSLSVVDLEYVAPDELIQNLDTIFGGNSGPIGSQVQFVPLPRQGAVLIIAKKAFRIEQVKTWIKQFDKRVKGVGRSLHFLPVYNADAEKLADLIGEILGVGGVSQQTSPQQSRGQRSTSNSVFRVRADSATNSLVINSNEEEFRQIKDLVNRLDILPHQVMIETTIAEVVLTDDLRYGVQWFLDSRDGGRTSLVDNSGGQVASKFPGFSYAFNGDYVRFALNALSSVTNVEVLSSPKLLALDNQPARLQVGDQVPIVTQSAVSITNPDAPIVNSVQFRDTGVVLQVTPQITDGNMVVLEIMQEVSGVAETTTSGIDSPTIQQRQFESTVAVADGETIALGGLIRSTVAKSNSGIPYLKNIPILGEAFKSSSDVRRRTELILFLRPVIIRSVGDARRMTEELQRRLKDIENSRFANDGED